MKKIVFSFALLLSLFVSFFYAPQASAVQDQLNKGFDIYRYPGTKISENPFSDPRMVFIQRNTDLVSLSNKNYYTVDKPDFTVFMSTLDEPAYIDAVKVPAFSARFSMTFYDSNKNLVATSKNGSELRTFTPPLKPIKYIGYWFYNYSSDWYKISWLTATGDYIGQLPNVSDVNIVADMKKADVNFKFPESTSPLFLKVYLNERLLYDSVTDDHFSLQDLKPDTEYNLKMSVSDGEIVSPISSYTFKTKALPKPKDVMNVTVEPTDSKATVSYTLPTEDFDHLELHKDNVVIKSNITANSFDITDLIPSMTYNYKLYAFSKDGVRSDGYDLTFKTAAKPDAPPPKAPKGLDIKAGNAALFVKWNANEEKDVIAYNLFLNGKKITTVKGTSYTLSDLKNDVSYSVSVQAVNSSSKTSDLTTKTGTPYEKGMPSFKNGYKLKDVGDGVTSWFSSLWLILAFAIGIPLAFYISHRVKALFFT